MSDQEWLHGDTRVAAIRFGTRSCMKSTVFFQYEQYGDPDVDCGMDYFVWVIKTGGEIILVDTGFDAAAGERRGRTLLCPPAEALRRGGVSPESVTKILLSHMHYDHTGNIKAFPNAEIILQKREFEFWTGPYASKTHFVHELEPGDLEVILEAQRNGRLRYVDGDETVAPGVQVRLVGGHTVGQQIVVVDGAGSRVVLATDSLHYYEEIEKDRPYIGFVNLVEMYRAYDLLRELTSQGPVVLVPGHDPEVTRRFATVEGDNAGLIFPIA